MNSSIKEKAIKQAIASLSIDKIFVNQEHVNSYRRKNNIPIVRKGPSLTLKRGVSNVRL